MSDIIFLISSAFNFIFDILNTYLCYICCAFPCVLALLGFVRRLIRGDFTSFQIR